MRDKLVGLVFQEGTRELVDYLTEAHLEKGELFPVLLLSVSNVCIPGCDAVFQLISPSVEPYASHSPEVNNGASHSVVFPSNNTTFAQK